MATRLDNTCYRWQQSFTVANIATEDECQKLGNRLSKTVNATFECIQYKVASPQ